MAKPTYQDADVMIKMIQWGTDVDIVNIRNWVLSDDFVQDPDEFYKKFPAGSDEQKKLSTYFMWFETLGTLYKNGLFSGELLFDWLLISRDWERVKGHALSAREYVGNSRILENFELMAKDCPE